MTVFLTGATGYFGGTIAQRLREAGHDVVGLIREGGRATAEEMEARGITPVIGTLDDLDVLAQQAAAADVIINTANVDHRPSVDVFLKAIEDKKKIFIQTGGSAIVADCAEGEPSDKIYDESSPISPLPLRVDRNQTKDDVLAAGARGLRAVVVAPPMVYGGGLGVNTESIQIPMMIAVAKKYGAARYVGKGANRWSNCHIEDLADIYLLAMEKGVPGGYYYAENGEEDMKTICRSISKMLGYGDKVDSIDIAQACVDYGDVPAQYSFGSNSRVRGVRTREELGWTPHRPSLLTEIEQGYYAGLNTAGA